MAIALFLIWDNLNPSSGCHTWIIGTGKSCINVFMAFGVLLGTIFFCYRNIEFRVVIYVNLYFLWPLIRKILFIIAVISWISFYLIGYSIFYGFLLSSFLLIGVIVIFQRMSGSLHLFLRSERYPVSIDWFYSVFIILLRICDEV